jgi:hypothetical protein
MSADADLTYTVTLSIPIHRDADEPLTPVEAVGCFQDEADLREWIYRVEMPDGTVVRVDMPGGSHVTEDRPTRLFALLSEQGTACAETVLTEDEYNDPERRRAAENRARLTSGDDPPVPGTWTDVTDNDAIRSIFEED